MALVASRAFKRGQRRFWARTAALGTAVPVVLCAVAWLNFAVCTRGMDLDWSSDAQTPGLTNIGNVILPLLVAVVAAIALCVLLAGAPQAGEAMPRDNDVGLYLAMVTAALAIVGGAPAVLCAWLARDDGPIIVPRKTPPAATESV